MLRCRSAFVSSKLVSTTATSCALLTTPLRRYEYPVFVGNRSAHADARSAQIDSTYEWTTVRQRDSKTALSLTGNADSITYDANTMYNPQADVEQLAGKFQMLKGHRKYAIDPVTDKAVRIAADLFEKADKEAVWLALFKDYPSLRTPLDDPTRIKLMNLFEKCIDNARDEKVVTELCAPIVREMLEVKHFHQPLWWRVQEKLVEGMIAQGEGIYHTRACHQVTERVTKILFNTFADLPWASEEYVSPVYTDVCGTRACTEAGFW